MRKSLFKNLPINATFTIRGTPYRKNSSTTAIALSGTSIGRQFPIEPYTYVNWHKNSK